MSLKTTRKPMQIVRCCIPCKEKFSKQKTNPKYCAHASFVFSESRKKGLRRMCNGAHPLGSFFKKEKDFLWVYAIEHPLGLFLASKYHKDRPSGVCNGTHTP